MAKKQVAVTLRKPPSADAAAYIARAANESGRTSMRTARATDELVARSDGQLLRELTVYLPPELARKLSLACMEKDRDVSNVLAEMISEHLGQPAPAQQAPADSIVQALENAQKMLFALWEKRPRFV